MVQRRFHCIHYLETVLPVVAELRKMRRERNVKKDDVFVEVPEPEVWLDSATLPMFLTVVAIALFAKLLMIVMISSCIFMFSVLVLFSYCKAQNIQLRLCTGTYMIRYVLIKCSHCKCKIS